MILSEGAEVANTSLGLSANAVALYSPEPTTKAEALLVSGASGLFGMGLDAFQLAIDPSKERAIDLGLGFLFNRLGGFKSAKIDKAHGSFDGRIPSKFRNTLSGKFSPKVLGMEGQNMDAASNVALDFGKTALKDFMVTE